MLRTVFAVTLCLLALQCYSSAALAPHLECDAFWDAITYCGGSSSVAVQERRWCERCCEGLSAQDTGMDSDIFSEGVAATNVVSDSVSLRLAMSRASQFTSDSGQYSQDRANFFGPTTCRSAGATCTGTQTCCSGLANVGGVCVNDTLGPNTCRSSGATCTGTQVCCSGLVNQNGVCVLAKRSEIQERDAPTVTGNERCHHHWSLSGPDGYSGNCFIRRLSTHLPDNYKIFNNGSKTYCNGVPVGVRDELTFGAAVPGRLIGGFYHIDKCQSNMNWCHCCARKKSSPTFGSWELTAGPGLDMDHFADLDGGETLSGFGPNSCRTSGATCTGTQTCCTGLINQNGVCVADNLGPNSCRTAGATCTGTQTCCSGLVNQNGVCVIA